MSKYADGTVIQLKKIVVNKLLIIVALKSGQQPKKTHHTKLTQNTQLVARFLQMDEVLTVMRSMLIK